MTWLKGLLLLGTSILTSLGCQDKPTIEQDSVRPSPAASNSAAPLPSAPLSTSATPAHAVVPAPGATLPPPAPSTVPSTATPNSAAPSSTGAPQQRAPHPDEFPYFEGEHNGQYWGQ